MMLAISKRIPRKEEGRGTDVAMERKARWVEEERREDDELETRRGSRS